MARPSRRASTAGDAGDRMTCEDEIGEFRPGKGPLRLGVYQDGPFRAVKRGGGIELAPDPVDAPFLRFVVEVARLTGSLAVFARIAPPAGADETVPLLPRSVEVLALPDYGSLRRLGSVARTSVHTARAFWEGLSHVDVVWAFGPHPLELLLVALARIRRKQVVLGVRQDTREYFRARLPSRRWKPLLAGVSAMDGLHRFAARRLGATVVGEDNFRRYAEGGGRVLDMRPTLVSVGDIVPAPADPSWAGTATLLTVGRIDPEKNPLLLVDALAELDRRRPGRFRVRWVGVGPLASAVEKRAAELGVAHLLELVGYVPFGPGLLELYRGSHAFVHVSLTEGVPQVLTEALASGTPIVATDVGGVRMALEDGRGGLLVAPDDLGALVGALLRLADDRDLRLRLAQRGLELARQRTIEVEAARVAEFIRDA
jgi:glycosyltransferase involved in cell wall biosynthesis